MRVHISSQTHEATAQRLDLVQRLVSCALKRFSVKCEQYCDKVIRRRTDANGQTCTHFSLQKFFGQAFNVLKFLVVLMLGCSSRKENIMMYGLFMKLDLKRCLTFISNFC